MTVTAVYTARVWGGREESLDAGDQLDGGAQLEAHHCGQVSLRQLGETGAIYQVVGENLRNNESYNGDQQPVMSPWHSADSRPL